MLSKPVTLDRWSRVILWVWRIADRISPPPRPRPFAVCDEVTTVASGKVGSVIGIRHGRVFVDHGGTSIRDYAPKELRHVR